MENYKRVFGKANIFIFCNAASDDLMMLKISSFNKGNMHGRI